jgi:hypothetical protein
MTTKKNLERELMHDLGKDCKIKNRLGFFAIGLLGFFCPGVMIVVCAKVVARELSKLSDADRQNVQIIFNELNND